MLLTSASRAISRIGGAGFADFQQDLVNLSKRAWLARKPLDQAVC
jgi:glutamate synthase (NADPH/NADH) large chain